MAIFYSHNKHFGYLLAGLFWFILKLFLLKSSYHRTALITFLLFNIFLSEFVVAMNSVENELALPHPKKLYQYPHRDTNQNKIDCLIRQGIKLKITPLQKLEDAISFFEQAADQGDSRGMCWIGRVCEEKENLELAVRWYALGFQNDWFKDSAKAYKSSSYEGLKRLTEQKSEIKRIFLIYPFDVDTDKKKFGRYNTLINFYENKTAEPYLDEEENNLKIKRIKNELNLIIQNSPLQCQMVEKSYNNGVAYVEKGKYQEAETCFLKCTSIPDALHNLGHLYEEGHIGKKNGQRDYEKAAIYYENAKTSASFANLGRLYKNGIIGKIDETPDYQKALEYLECSGHQTALSNLGILFKEGYVGKIDDRPDYQTAKNYFKKSQSDDAYVRLGELCMQGHIGQNSPQPDYQQAEIYFRIAETHDYPSAYSKLGYLYLEGHIGKIDEQPDYQSAVNYFKKAITFSKESFSEADYKNAMYNLGVMHVRGHINQVSGQPNYQKAIKYFEKSQTSGAYYNIGNLYEQGNIGATGNGPNYNKAIDYYKKSELPQAKLAILGLYQVKHVKFEDKKNKTDIINNIINDINQKLQNLSDEKSYYIKGIAEYYLGSWEEALISLQNALLFGSEEEELSTLVEEIGKALESKKIAETTIEESVIESKIEENSSIIRLEDSPKEEVFEEDKILANKNKVLPVKTAKLNKYEKSIVKASLSKKKFLGFRTDSDLKAPKPSHSFIKFEFLNEKNKASFQLAKESNKKLQEVLDDIQENSWTTKGIGHPEVLKHSFKKYTGCLSRRLNQNDRFVYKITEPGTVLILSWDDHY